jgi:hypothetical protein
MSVRRDVRRCVPTHVGVHASRAVVAVVAVVVEVRVHQRRTQGRQRQSDG